MKFYALFFGVLPDGLETGKVTDVFTDPYMMQGQGFPLVECLHPSLYEHLVECPDYVVPGYSFDGTTWTAPPVPPEPN